MMIRTRQSRSRRHLRRTYSTKHTGRTVRCVYYIKDSLSCLSTCLITCMVAFCVYLGEIALLEGLTVVYKSNIDLFFYVIGSSHENEVSLILGFYNEPFLSKRCNPTIEQFMSKVTQTTRSTKSFNPILSLTTGVMFWTVGDQTVICELVVSAV